MIVLIKMKNILTCYRLKYLVSHLILTVKVFNDKYHCYLPFTITETGTEELSKCPKIVQLISKW